ncbi:MAG: protein kinase [Acidimicrobiia bacterium]|nr:protein kinase [Acidimicrobiia bacterium]
MDTIGRYEILSRIGSGGFATVYRARDPVLDSEVAVKVLADNWAGTPEIRDRFIREAQILRRIDSDRVITVHDIGELPSGQPYFVMALADRGTLEGRLDEGAALTPADAMSIARGMATCIIVVHSHGLIHRDIKPSNLLIAGPRLAAAAGPQPEPRSGILGANERLVLGDFGLAKDIELHTTGLTIAAGSGGYAAPEQMALAGVPSRLTDLFAATGVMYRVLAGRRPPGFDLERRRVPFPDGEWWMAGPLGAFFRQGMAYEPELRHDSIDHWLASFTAALAPYEAHTGAPGPAPGAAPPPEPAAPPSRRPATDGPGTDPSTDPTTVLPVVRSADTRFPSPDLDETVHRPTTIHGGSPGSPATPSHSGHSHASPSYPAATSSPVAPAAPSPYGTGSSPYGTGSSPYGTGSSPYGTGSSPYGTGSSPYGVPGEQVPKASPAFDLGPGPGAPARRSRRWFLGGLVVAAGGAAAGGWYLLRPDGPAVEGPDAIVAGQSATYIATLAGATSYEWTDPNGQVQAVPSLQVNAVIPGSISFSVVGLTAGGRSAATTRTVEVVAAPDGPRIEGPPTVKVNEAATYSYSYDGAGQNPVWIDPDGRQSQGEQYRVTASSPGRYLIRLQLDRPGSTRIGAAREIQLVE